MVGWLVGFGFWILEGRVGGRVEGRLEGRVWEDEVGLGLEMRWGGEGREEE